MRIDPTMRVGGRPLVDCRTMLRRLGADAHDLMGVQLALAVSPMEAHRLINFLYLQGFLERDPAAPDQLRWIRTWAGQEVADAYVARPLSRGAVEQLLQAILGRVHEINRNPRFRYKITAVGVLEGYRAADDPFYGLDLALAVSVKEPDPLGPHALPALPSHGGPERVSTASLMRLRDRGPSIQEVTPFLTPWLLWMPLVGTEIARKFTRMFDLVVASFTVNFESCRRLHESITDTEGDLPCNDHSGHG